MIGPVPASVLNTSDKSIALSHGGHDRIQSFENLDNSPHWPGSPCPQTLIMRGDENRQHAGDLEHHTVFRIHYVSLIIIDAVRK